MQSTLYSPSSCSTNFFHLSWASTTSDQTSFRQVKLACPKTLLKPLSVSNTVKTSFNFHDLKNPEPEKAYPLPIVVRESGAASRYYWDGARLESVSLDGNSLSIWDFSVDFEDAVRKLTRISASALRDFFLPRQVSENYMQYVKWKFLHRVFSSALQVLATQAMFRAIGIGYRRSLPSAAALNWVLKDGLGRLCRCIYTASLASAFDTNLKRVRFSTSVLFTLSIGVELLTPVFPSYFLLLASVANIAKQISLACYLATGSAVHRSFAVADNLGEVSAKAQIQTVCFDNLGLVLAAFLNVVLRNNQRLQAALPFVVYPIFSAIDLFGIYQGLNHVHLQTLTKDRLEIIMKAWFERGYVPSPAEVSKAEGINLSWKKGRELWPIRIGCLNLKGQLSELARLTIQTLDPEDFYFICLENFSNRLSKTAQDKAPHRVVVCIREGANSVDIMKGLLHGCYVRKHLLSGKISCENKAAYPAFEEWFQLIKDSKKIADDGVNSLVREMSSLGWACKNVLLTAQEQARYSFVAE